MATNSAGSYTNGDDFLDSRRGWLQVGVLDTEGGGFDIILTLDGTYYGDRSEAEEIAELFASDIRALLSRLPGAGDQR